MIINKMPKMRRSTDSPIITHPNHINTIRTVNTSVFELWNREYNWAFSYKYACVYKEVKDLDDMTYSRFQNYTVRANYVN